MTGDLAPAVAGGALEGLPLSVAVLDDEGTILATNASWRSFATENGIAPEDAAMVGLDYLEPARHAPDDPYASRAVRELEALLAGERGTVAVEYPCHSPTERRWFRMDAGRFAVDGETFAVVAHANITDRKEAELAAADRVEELQAFARMLSHDVRNPLAVAVGYLEEAHVALETSTGAPDAGDREGTGDLDAAALRDDLAHVERSLARIDELVDSTLRLVGEGVGARERERVDVEAIARRAWENVPTDDATLEVSGTLELRAYPALLAELLENLFANAVQHAATGERPVAVRLELATDGFAVCDDGPGIPVDRRGGLFRFGGEGDGERGNGLPIVRRLAELHGWTVTAGAAAGGGARIAVDTAAAASVEPAAAQASEDGAGD